MRRAVILETPLTSEDISRLSVGDLVYLKGHIIMMKTPGYARALDCASRGEKMPVPFNGAAIYHGFAALDEEGENIRTHYLGPTLSYRYSDLAPRMISELGVKAFIGKMGAPMSEETLESMKRDCCIHLAQIGGVTAYNSGQLEGPVKRFWTDIAGESCMIYKAKKMGPLAVSMDTRGESLFSRVEALKRSAILRITS
jgi:tartrate/fumarate subfamily iron-sulfur-dependent hydro-lyase beta chain